MIDLLDESQGENSLNIRESDVLYSKPDQNTRIEYLGLFEQNRVQRMGERVSVF